MKRPPPVSHFQVLSKYISTTSLVLSGFGVFVPPAAWTALGAITARQSTKAENPQLLIVVLITASSFYCPTLLSASIISPVATVGDGATAGSACISR